MGLFSLFRKAEPLPPLTDDEQARLAANSEALRQSQALRQRELARATTLKIDAIESAMAADIFHHSEPAWGSQRPSRDGNAGAGANAVPDDIPTTLLLTDDLPLAAAASAPATEEIAILYANGQADVAQQMLEDAVAAANTLNSDRSAWWMLFDLYQVSGQQDAFDNLSIDYASTFETSPPPWTAPAVLAAASPGWAGLTPTAALSGTLDAQLAPQLQRLHHENSPVLRLEFTRLTAVTADGCALLLDTLRLLQAQQRELILVGAPALTARLRDGIKVGRRADGVAAWLLMLELLQLQNLEKAFEHAAMDYCVTFEVSPPSFVAPRQIKVAMAPAQHLSASSDRFMLPPVIETQLGALLPAIQQYAEQYPALVFDCSRLTRIDYASAIELHGTLRALAGDGRHIALRDVNHLVATLLRLLGFANLARIYPHKY